MNPQLILATRTGLLVCTPEGEGWRVDQEGLAGRYITSVIAREGVILAGSRGGVWRSDDQGASWQPANQGLSLANVRWLSFHPEISDREFAGCEPAGLFLSQDGGGHWHARPEVALLREAHGWYLPYSPEAGCVRGFAFHGQRAFAAVEVGGVLRSEDGGLNWALAPGSDGDPYLAGDASPKVHPDVHALTAHSSSPDLVFAATGGGLYRSEDGGTRWERLHPQYCRDVWVDPQDPDHLVLGPARYVGREGTLSVSRDGGRSWHTAGDGLALPWRSAMVERFSLAGGQLVAVLSNGELYGAALDSLHWHRLLPQVEGVQAVCYDPG